MPTNDVNARVNKHRAALRMAGLRPVQIWVPIPDGPISRRNAVGSPSWPLMTIPTTPKYTV
jgi:hypothetical protein